MRNMRKVSISVLALICLSINLGVPAKAETLQTGQPSIDASRPREAVQDQDSERAQELLEIWKDHVRTITKERDEAYKEIDTLKSQTAKQQFAIEVAPIPAVQNPNSFNDSEFESKLEDINTRLISVQSEKDSMTQQKNEALSQLQSREAKNRDLESQLRAIRAQAIKSKPATDTELQKLRQDKQSADERVQVLQARVQELESRPVAASEATKDFSSEIAGLESEKQEIKKAFDQNKSESEAEIARLNDLNRALQAENKRLQLAREEVQQTDFDRDRLLKEKESITNEYKGLENRYKKRDADFTQASARVGGLENTITMLKKDHLESTNTISKLESQLNSIEEKNKSREQSLATLNARVAELNEANTAVKNQEAKYQKTIEELQAGLAANLADMQNLKANFEAYLESLVSSFDERQKK